MPDILQPTSPNPPEVKPPPVVPAASAKSNVTSIFVTMFIIVAVGVGSFLITKSFYEPKPTQPLPSPVAQQPSPSTDPTANWKTYLNTTHNISFKYPSSWKLTEKGKQGQLGGTYNETIELAYDDALITMIFNMNGIGGQPQTYEGEAIVLDGNNLYKFKTNSSYNDTKRVGISNSLTTLGVFEINGITHSILLTYPVNYAAAKESIILNEFDQILSTFKFL